MGTVLLAKNMYITNVDWCKRTGSLYHRFLAAHVKKQTRSDGHIPHKSVIWIDRSISQLGGQKNQKNWKEGWNDGSESVLQGMGLKDLPHVL